MLKPLTILTVTTAAVLTGCGQQPQQHTTNPQFQNNSPQYQTTQSTNPNIDCTPIVNPNYVPGGNQAQYYYPEGCQAIVNNTNTLNTGYVNNPNIGGYVGAAAVGAAAGALATRAYNRNTNNRNYQNRPTNNATITAPSNHQPSRANAGTYTPANRNNGSVSRQTSNRTPSVIRSTRRR